MTRADQDRIVRWLVEQGILDGSELPSREEGDDELLDPLDFLLRRGLVDAAVVATAAEALASTETEVGLSTTEPGEPPSTQPASEPGDLDSDSPDLSRWDRYRVVRRLGQGGSGTVYKAHDPELDRDVAIKVLTSSGGGALREARMQARVAHPGVCEVYEVGWVQGRPYIAMQLVQGETLHVAARTMTREEIVCAIRDAAVAVHAAHGIGLVHRDLKPGNLMIERSLERGTHCYVLDFGVAKEVSGQSSTLTGSVLGTPAFMAPEQARGDVRRIDRRTDVHALGATLYSALAGCPPFSGEAAGILHAVLHDAPIPLRKRDPSVARDLDTIVMKCLEKDPSRRYDSARALAEDLSCYLTGDPIKARRASLWDRLSRWARQNPALAVVSLLFVLAAVTLGTGWARARARAEEQADEARRFGQEAESIESAARLAYLAPLHDVRGDRAQLRARMDALAARTAGQSGAARAAGHEAAGRGALSLHAYQEAREQLDAAWREGSRNPEMAYARASAYAALYEEALPAVQALTDPAVRAARLLELQKELRDPARESLAQAQQGSSARAAVIAGRIAYYEGRHDEAIEHAREGAEQSPWDYEVRRLLGDAQRAAGREEESRGNHEAAIGRFNAAAEAFAAAAAIGRSDAEAHVSECQARAQGISIHVDSLQRPVAPEAFSVALAACDRAIVADGDRPDAMDQKAHLLMLRGSQALDHSESPGTDLDTTIELAQEVIAAHPERADAYATLGLGLYKQARYEESGGIDARPTLAAAIDALECATTLDPELLVAQNNLGVLHRMRADDALRRGEDPRAALDAAVARYEITSALDPSFLGVWNNIGRAVALKAEYELREGLSAAASLAAATAAHRRSTAALPEMPMTHNNLGSALYLQAASTFLAGGDPGPLLGEAQAAFAQALSRNPNYAFALKNRGDADVLGASHALRKGLSGADLLARAVTEYQAAIRAKPAYPGAYRGLSAAHRLSAYEQASRGLDARDALTAARTTLAAAQALAPSDADTALAAAATDRLAGALAADRQRPGAKPTRAAREALDAARAEDPLALWVPKTKGGTK